MRYIYLYWLFTGQKISPGSQLESLCSFSHTLVFYESTHRILDCIDDIGAVFGKSSHLVLAKELTKTFERFVSGSVMDVKNWLLEDNNHIKGEFVLMIPPREQMVENETNTHEKILSILLEEIPLKQAVNIAGKLTGAAKNQLYQQALNFKRGKDV